VAVLREQVVFDLSPLRAIQSAAKSRAITLKAVKAAAKIVQPAAKSRAPRRKAKGGGGLRQSIGIKTVKGTHGKTVALAVIGARKKVVRYVVGAYGGKPQKHVPAYIAHMVEDGTRAHAITKGSRLARSGKTSGATGQGKVNHPGSKPNPFLRSAWAAVRQQAIAAGQAVLLAEVQKYMQKQAARGKRG
jgi:HK97 gp10 family phage protein